MAKRDDKKERKICLYCSKYIFLKKDHHVQVHTLNRKIHADEHAYFHFQCWVDYFNIRVENKMRANMKFLQEKAMGIFNHPMLKGLLSQVQGSDIALQMLQHPISDHVVVVSGEKVEKQIQNDRQKRSAKRKTKMQ
jgi:hypothetical protein